MPNNPKIIKDGQIIDNEWLIVEDAGSSLPEGKLLVSLEIWEAQKAALIARGNIGVWLKNDQDPASLAGDLQELPIIGIDFPVFMDGRGFSIARLLRDRYSYKGEVRALGHVIRDQLCYLKRCGINAFDLDDDIDIEQAVHSLNDFTDGYQTDASQKVPLFRRRA